AGDFDGDGRSDIAYTAGFTPDYLPWSSIPVAFSRGDGNWTGTNQYVPIFPGASVTGDAILLAGDFNADGKSAIALINGGSGYDQVVLFALSLGDGNFTVQASSATALTTVYAKQGGRGFSGDFDGDGRTDIGLVGGSSGGVRWNYMPIAFSDGLLGFSSITTAT